MDSTAIAGSRKPADALPAHLNTVVSPIDIDPGSAANKEQLVQIGRIFQHSSRPDFKAHSRPRSQAIEALTKANRQFHETLDEVEIELVRGISFRPSLSALSWSMP